MLNRVSAAARPAERVGIHLEPDLIAELVADTTGQPGALPLFQYVLTEQFEQRAVLLDPDGASCVVRDPVPRSGTVLSPLLPAAAAYRKVIDSVDVVLIACAAKFHPMYLKAGIEAGKHVFVEKPHAIDQLGIKVVMRAIEEPLRQIANNAGKEGSVIVRDILAKSGNEGYNAATDKYEDMIKAIADRLNLTSLKYQRLDDLVQAIGLPKEKVCTYCSALRHCLMESWRGPAESSRPADKRRWPSVQACFSRTASAPASAPCWPPA